MRPLRHHRALVATLVVASAFAVATPVAAQQDSTSYSPRLRGQLRLAGEHGGEKVLEFEYEDGSTPDVIAGGGLSFTLGAAYRALETRAGGLDAQVAVGIKYRTIPEASNQSAEWKRYPLEGMLVFRSKRGFGVGAGATMHLGNALEVSGEVANAKLEFDNAPGVVVQAEYALKGVTFDARYTAMKYTLANATSGSSGSIDASNIGIGVTLVFGRKGFTR